MTFEDVAGITEASLREIMRILLSSDVTELDVEVAGTSLRLRREQMPTGVRPQAFDVPESGSQTHAGAPEATNSTVVTSPLVGIFRLQVQVGDVVRVGQRLGAIEALGLPTEVDAPSDGRVQQISSADATPVEFGQALLVLAHEDTAVPDNAH